MRQTIHTTGIPEVDDQHRRIDELIAGYRQACNQAEEQQYLGTLYQAAKIHFLFLGYFFDVKFPDEFRRRQQEILDWLAGMIEKRSKDGIGQQELADELHRIFLLNAAGEKSRLRDRI